MILKLLHNDELLFEEIEKFRPRLISGKAIAQHFGVVTAREMEKPPDICPRILGYYNEQNLIPYIKIIVQTKAWIDEEDRIF